MRDECRGRKIGWGVRCLAVLALLTLAREAPAGRAAGAPAPAWHDTGVILSDSNALRCFDATQPTALVVGSSTTSNLGPPGTYTLDWHTGRATRLSAIAATDCNPENGLLFATDPTTEATVRFTVQAPAAIPIAHRPTFVAVDGSLQVYAYSYPAHDGDASRLWASADGGLTWQERILPEPTSGSISISGADPHAIYWTANTYSHLRNELHYAIYFSPDAGATWDKRAEATIPSSGFVAVSAYFLAGPLAPLNTVEIGITNGIPGSNGASTIYLSTDGARTFAQVGYIAIAAETRLLQVPEGILRLQAGNGQNYNLAISPDAGHSWEARPLPFTPRPPPGGMDLEQAPQAPASLFVRDYLNAAVYWYSPDAGRSWQNLGPVAGTPMISHAVPLTLVSIDPTDHHLRTLDLPDASKALTAAVAAVGGANSRYFPETHHNLAGPLGRTWAALGGLAQFGYPRTEAFREVSPTDGRIYRVQYFERNRFEYHPENAGTPYAVQLGLLGVEATTAQRAAGHGAFNRFADLHYPHGTYFPQTGHNLRNSFLDYWQRTGGLALYGYPISEEFDEINPDDGRSYVVQYFERNRFEYHPENKNTPYEVLLGLLGNRLLQAKGWLP